MSNLQGYLLGIIEELQNKKVEIYCGDNSQTQSWVDHEEHKKDVIIGTIVKAIGDCLIVQVKRHNKTAKIYINSYNIVCIVPIVDQLFISDIFQNEEAKSFRKSPK